MNKIIGVTGPSGAGKGLFCAYLAEFGCTVIDCDKIAHSVTKKGSPCLAELVKAFGVEILTKDGRLNRRKLALIAFSDPIKTELLNQITHPAILKIIDNKIQKAKSTVALDAPLLVEGRLDQICDVVAVIDADEQTRIDRITARDHLTREAAVTRLKAKKPLERIEKMRYYINNGTQEQLRDFAREVFESIKISTLK
ncbi:MAG TPA: dephospho-CoA kinase [Oscillospiraceae bacterium]|nr:dephospho-CoA kinase [Oscillospiraceae bacterium]HPS35346.1 dephospho-CoA kinase [Oscillospiraceae bacterium]